jgi:hypothetical protein
MFVTANRRYPAPLDLDSTFTTAFTHYRFPIFLCLVLHRTIYPLLDFKTEQACFSYYNRPALVTTCIDFKTLEFSAHLLLSSALIERLRLVIVNTTTTYCAFRTRDS